MKLFKQFLGFLLLLFAGLITLSLVFAMVKAVLQTITELQKDTAYGIGYLIGTCIGLVIIGGLIYFLAKVGLRLVKGKAAKKESIDDIGANNPTASP